MIGRRRLVVLALFVSSLSCSKQECVDLGRLRDEHELVANRVRIQAEKADELEKSATALEVETSAMVGKLGLTEKDEKLDAALEARVQKLPGATLKALDVPAAPQQGPTPRQWTVSFKEKSARVAFQRAADLAEVPPLFEIKTLVDDGGGQWSLQLERPILDRIDAKPVPVKVAMPRGPETIPSTFTTCGAGAIREQVAKLRDEIAQKTPRAEAMTQLAQKRATTLGEKRRAALLVERERETRRLQKLLLEAADEAKVVIKAVGFEEPMVILELRGTSKDRAKVEAKLPKELESAIGRPEGGGAGIVRLSLPNEVSRSPRNRQIGARYRPMPEKSAVEEDSE
ncbi:MAG: hypothetical protein HYV07_33395 [Deltaproteobacteria bacterium]|nr:hypothetical protein [Deltaproteobacteria bacterium]